MAESKYLNHQIKANTVLLIDETGAKLGNISLKDAVLKAKEKGLDLLQVSESSLIPVCKIVDLGKLKYEESKKKHVHNGDMTKEIRIGFNISEHDFQTKLSHVTEFLKKHYKVNYVLKLKGCPRSQVGQAIEKFHKFLEPLTEHATWTQPKQFDKTISVMLMPKAKEKPQV